MSALIKSGYDKLLAAFALGLMAVSGGWAWLHQGAIDLIRNHAVTTELTSAAYTPPVLPRTETQPTAWARPAAQSHGRGWLYEVFTPPVIYYNPLARSFAVTPPLNPTEGDTPFGLELLQVMLEPYRLQLVGYFGGPGDYLAAFVSQELPETLLARSGRRFEQLGLTLKSLDVKKVEVSRDDERPVYDVAALAVLLDEKSGTEVVLDSRARKLTDTPLAVLRLGPGGNRSRTLHEGDAFSDETGSYRIERIQLDPPEVVLVRQTAGLPLPESRILRPTGQAGGQIAGQPTKAGKFTSSPKAGLASHNP